MRVVVLGRCGRCAAIYILWPGAYAKIEELEGSGVRCSISKENELVIVVTENVKLIVLFIRNMNPVVTPNGVAIPKEKAFSPYSFTGGYVLVVLPCVQWSNYTKITKGGGR